MLWYFVIFSKDRECRRNVNTFVLKWEWWCICFKFMVRGCLMSGILSLGRVCLFFQKTRNKQTTPTQTNKKRKMKQQKSTCQILLGSNQDLLLRSGTNKLISYTSNLTNCSKLSNSPWLLCSAVAEGLDPKLPSISLSPCSSRIGPHKGKKYLLPRLLNHAW